MVSCSSTFVDSNRFIPGLCPIEFREQSSHPPLQKSSTGIIAEKINYDGYSTVLNRAFSQVKEVKNYVKANSKSMFWSGMGMYNSYRLLDSGIAKLLCLETLRHGTSLSSYIGIHLNGPNPGFGGTGGCESQHFCSDSINWFHAVADTSFATAGEPSILNAIGTPFAKRFVPRFYAVSAQTKQIHEFITSQSLPNSIINGDYNFWNLIFDVPSAALGAIVPTIKLRFTPEEVAEKFVKDHTMAGNTTIRTREHISIYHTGITGSLVQGLDRGLFQRVANDPLKAVTGVLSIAAAVYMAKKTYDYIQSKPAAADETPAEVPSTSTWKQRCVKYILYPYLVGATLLVSAT